MNLKKISAIILTAAIFINTYGYVFIYWNLKKVYKQVMFSRIESGAINGELEEIVVPQNLIGTAKLVRVEEREIKYNGKMYDIVREYSKDGFIHFICINDENEDFLDKLFIETVDNNSNKKADNNPVHNILKFSISSAVINDDETNIFVSSDKYYPAIYLIHDDHPQEIQTPPPQFLL